MQPIELMDESFYKHLVHTYDSINDTKRRMLGGTSFITQKHWNQILVGLMEIFEDTMEHQKRSWKSFDRLYPFFTFVGQTEYKSNFSVQSPKLQL